MILTSNDTEPENYTLIENKTPSRPLPLQSMERFFRGGKNEDLSLLVELHRMTAFAAWNTSDDCILSGGD